ncbi:hypothetical protein FA10DRAFT_258315 [Acaromyces ingoldii]|uniref:Transcription activator GCR1-like domain-containing protein n=1 Tax=Acaromyces ingoldii TaxID=215250 RepID=A0A316Z1X6_9BASI|nr:hypothetical protein FA10DRAFT_258315 [Acaromyces ingoldii]PWN94183.1 hypothetical protein FA10DRAFT_258315 [Acaromyces ingoldii]
MVDKKLTCLLSHLCCILVFAKCMQVGHPIQTDAKGNRGKDIVYTEEQFERFLLGPLPEQHPSSPPPLPGSGSVPESAASTSKDLLTSTFPSPREQEVEGHFQIEAESSVASQRYAPSSSSPPFTFDGNNFDLYDFDHVPQHLNAPWSPTPSEPFRVENSLGPDRQTENPTQKKGRGPKIIIEEDSCVMTKRKCQRELNEFWEACDNAIAQVAWSKYRTNIMKLFKRIAVAAFKEGKDLQKVLENYCLRNKRISSWLNSLIDHPIFLLEDTMNAEKDPGLHKYISDWAATARDTLAAQRGGHLNFTEKVNRVWRLKAADERLKSQRLTEGPEPYSAGVGRARIRLTEDHGDVKRLREKRQRASMKADGSLNRDRDRKGTTSRQPPLQESIIKDETSSAVDGRHDVWSGCGDEIRDEWKTYATDITKSLCKDAEKSLKSGKALESVIYGEPRYNRPPTWHNSILDHPTTLVEDRPSIRRDQPVHKLVSEWAKMARNELAEKRELRYMQKLVGSDTWTLKPLEGRMVKEGPDRWRSKGKTRMVNNSPEQRKTTFLVPMS